MKCSNKRQKREYSVVFTLSVKEWEDKTYQPHFLFDKRNGYCAIIVIYQNRLNRNDQQNKVVILKFTAIPPFLSIYLLIL